jgi:hypothetical protein
MHETDDRLRQSQSLLASTTDVGIWKRGEGVFANSCLGIKFLIERVDYVMQTSAQLFHAARNREQSVGMVKIKRSMFLGLLCGSQCFFRFQMSF